MKDREKLARALRKCTEDVKWLKLVAKGMGCNAQREAVGVSGPGGPSDPCEEALALQAAANALVDESCPPGT